VETPHISRTHTATHATHTGHVHQAYTKRVHHSPGHHTAHLRLGSIVVLVVTE
jgi:hypothetical protein